MSKEKSPRSVLIHVVDFLLVILAVVAAVFLYLIVKGGTPVVATTEAQESSTQGQEKPVVTTEFPSAERLFGTTEHIIPGRFIYHNKALYLITEVKLADVKVAVVGSKEFIRTQDVGVKIEGNKIVATSSLPPNIGKFEVYGHKIVDM